jgi:imidazolonepropionase-like amidohydrolase
MASGNPAELLGVADGLGSVEIGRRADLVLFRWDDETKTFEVVATIIDEE